MKASQTASPDHGIGHVSNVEAQLKLGDYMYWGLGTAVDLEGAVAHYRTASEARSAS